MAKGKSPKYLVFISHSSKDTWVAKQIADRVAACGAKPFLDEADVQIADDFEEEILGFLNRADELLVLLTPWALARPYVWAELGVAWGRRIPIVSVLHGITPEDLQRRPEVPTFLKRRDMLDLNEIDGYFGHLRKQMKTVESKRHKP